MGSVADNTEGLGYKRVDDVLVGRKIEVDLVRLARSDVLQAQKVG